MNKLVKVEISIKEGIYLATSEDLPGLFVADKNFIAFVSEIPEVIKAIHKEQFNENVTVEEELTGKKEEGFIKAINFITKKAA